MTSVIPDIIIEIPNRKPITNSFVPISANIQRKIMLAILDIISIFFGFILTPHHFCSFACIIITRHAPRLAPIVNKNAFQS